MVAPGHLGIRPRPGFSESVKPADDLEASNVILHKFSTVSCCFLTNEMTILEQLEYFVYLM